MQRFVQFELVSHNLPVIAGRFCGIASLRADRVCTHCGGIPVADEHMVHERQVLQPLRQQYAALSTSNTDSMMSFLATGPHASFQVFFRLSSLPGSLALFIPPPSDPFQIRGVVNQAKLPAF